MFNFKGISFKLHFGQTMASIFDYFTLRQNLMKVHNQIHENLMHVQTLQNI